MTIGIIVDGDAESQALKKIAPKLVGAKPIIGPYFANMQPYSPPLAIARAAVKTMQMAETRGATEFVILIDREDNQVCPTDIARGLIQAFKKLGYPVQVVVKNKTFENWLIADPNALASQRKRFKVSQTVRNRITPNKADNIDNAETILDQCAVKTPYHKRRDAIRICDNLDLTAAASNSRSLRRFLRLLNDQRYRNQSKLP